jgi:ribosome assembly protein YihI (activator of Der GTPase)
MIASKSDDRQPRRTHQERDPRMGSRDAASKSEGFASQERDPGMGSRDAA